MSRTRRDQRQFKRKAKRRGSAQAAMVRKSKTRAS